MFQHTTTGFAAALCLLVASLCQSIHGQSFADDHADDQLLNWDIVGDRGWTEAGGQARPKDGSGATGFLLRQNVQALDGVFEVEVEADPWNGHRGGVVLRWESPSRFLFIGVRGSSPYEPHVYVCRDALDDCASTGNVNLNLGNRIRLRVEASGDQFRVLLDEQEAALLYEPGRGAGRLGYAHSGEWNRLASFGPVQWTQAALSSSSEGPVSSQGDLSSATQPSSSSSSALVVIPENEPTPQLQGRLLGSAHNWYAVVLVLRGGGAELPAGTRLGWHFNWADHSDALLPEVDHASAPVALDWEERDDFSGTVWLQLQQNLAAGDSLVAHVRLHTQDWTAIDPANDPSWQALQGATQQSLGTVVLPDGSSYLSPIPRNPFPTTARQEAQVRTVVSQHSDNTLALNCYVQNTGEVPLRSVRFSWYGHSLPTEAAIEAVVDWSEVPGTQVRLHNSGDGFYEVVVDLGPGLLPIGVVRRIDLRIHSANGSALDFTDDFSWAGVASGGANPQISVRSDGLLVGGQLPWALDSDGDGVPDAVEQQHGTDPLDPADYPQAGIPDQPVLTAQEGPVYVTYNFGNVPGYEEHQRVAVRMDPATLEGGAVPTIRYLGQEIPRPRDPDRRFVRLGGYFHVQAQITPGQHIQMAIPMPQGTGHNYDTSQVGARRFDETAGQWQNLQVVNYTQGVVHVQTSQFSDAAVGALVDPRRVAGGGEHLLNLEKRVHSPTDTSWRLQSMGRNSAGQLGQPGSQFQGGLADVVLPEGVEVRSVHAGQDFSLALDLDGRVWTFGGNTYGQLGRPTVGSSDWEPRQVAIPGNVFIKQVSVGAYHVFAQDIADNIWVWGRGDQGQLGLVLSGGAPDLAHREAPEQFSWPLDPVSGDQVPLYTMAAGGNFSFGLDGSGRMWSWGSNDAGQLLIPDADCDDSDYVEPETGGFTPRDACTYLTDDQIHSPALRSFQGHQGRVEQNVRGVRDSWIGQAAGHDFGVAQRKRMVPSGSRTAVWGTSLADVGLTSGYARHITAGAHHYAFTTQTGFVSDRFLPDDGNQVLVIPTCDSEIDCENTQRYCSSEGPDCTYLYRRTQVHLSGDNSAGALGSSNPSARTHILPIPEDLYDLRLGLGNQFTALWRDFGEHSTVELLGTMDGEDVGGEAPYLPLARVELASGQGSPTRHSVLPLVVLAEYTAPQVLMRIAGGEGITVAKPENALSETCGSRQCWRASVDLDISALADGAHSVQVAALAATGAPGPSHSVAFVVDRTPPMVVIVSPVAGARVPMDQTTLELTWHQDGGEEQQGTVDLDAQCPERTAGQDCTLEWTAADAAGNTGSASVVVEITNNLEIEGLAVTGSLSYPVQTGAGLQVQWAQNVQATVQLVVWKLGTSKQELCRVEVGQRPGGDQQSYTWNGQCASTGDWLAEGMYGISLLVYTPYQNASLHSGDLVGTARRVFRSLPQKFGRQLEIPVSVATSLDSLVQVRGLKEDLRNAAPVGVLRFSSATSEPVGVSNCANDGTPWHTHTQTEAGIVALDYYARPANVFSVVVESPTVTLAHSRVPGSLNSVLSLMLAEADTRDYEVRISGDNVHWDTETVRQQLGYLEWNVPIARNVDELSLPPPGWRGVQVQEKQNGNVVKTQCWGTYVE